METHEHQTQSGTVPYPNLPPLIDSRETEYRGTGITSSVAIFGHPIHPVIVIFPIAFLSGVAGTDLGYWLTQDFFWARAGIWLLGVGVLSAVAAAITGMADFINIPRVRQRRAGWAHIALNAGALLLSIINFGLRFGNPADRILPLGLILSWTVSVLLMASGWFGGELMFRHKVGIVGPGETQVE
ncbi:MAG: DUF2231 domain-containing protein [Leptolyngbyaceae cyanobacterium SM1_1_3]|nr:DUF2231 domain-containing protein [Leptolyngbyaceae cyanobacterium SM1_1_3]NJN03676.1 DUF2231 domain-containing protein [Leptolyngbyaceae cyanobacterium RM1_1_2]NJO09139.1 DUF2231 domain-containing protein [Leptolyngbyaceae cyanobacterium SL_1_1]